MLTQNNYFNSQEIKKRKIKTIQIEYSIKKPLMTIQKKHYKTTFFLFDSNGNITQFYYTKKLYNNILDTVVEWRFYNENRLSNIKKTEFNSIKTTSIFYQKNRPVKFLYGKSTNVSSTKTKLKTKNFKEGHAEYKEYIKLKNNDSLEQWISSNKTIFKEKLLSSIDSNLLKETITYSLNSKKNFHKTYEYKGNKLIKIETFYSSQANYYYTFSYDKNNKLTGFVKNSSKWKKEIEINRLVYDEKTNNLYALISKNLSNGEIEINKYKYTYYE